METSSNIGTRNGFMAIGQTNVLYTQLAASGNQLFMIPKYAVKDLDSLEDNDSLRIELDRHCVYFMVGKKDDKPAIYVGQAGHRTTTKKTVIKRLAEHTRDGYAPYWDTAYILVPKHEDRWEPTHINYLEYLFTTNIDKTKYVDISGDRVNDHIPNKPEDRQDCEDSYNDGLIYLSKFNIKLFNPIDKKPLNTNVIKDIKVENKIIRKLRSSALTEKKTPHNIVNDMLDLLPWERFNKNTTFFDPVCKVGEFLEEIRLRLFDLEMSHGEFDERGIYAAEACWHHITYNQLFGFTISEEARSFTINTLYGEIGYDAPNIKYIEDYEDIVKDTGTNKITEDEIKQYIRLIVESSKREAVTSGELKDSVSRYMYKSSLYKDRTKEDKDAIKQEITARKKLLCYKAILQKELGNMKFDVVIGNPPYNNDVYLDFVTLAYGIVKYTGHIVMITPAKWQAKGGPKNDLFRENIVPHMSKIVYYPDAFEIFDIREQEGITYYLICRSDILFKNKEISVSCKANNMLNSIETRDNVLQTLYGRNISSIIDKTYIFNEKRLSLNIGVKQSEYVQNTNSGHKTGEIAVYAGEKVSGYVEKSELKTIIGLERWKVSTSVMPVDVGFDKNGQMFGLSKTYVLKPNTIPKGSFPVLKKFDTELEANSFRSYCNTRLIRFLYFIGICGKTISEEFWRFVPDPGYFDHIFTDEELYKKYNLTPEEINIIESVIKAR